MGVRGAKKHLKRLHAPRNWMLDKLSGVFAPRPAPGPHKLRESLPLVVLLRNRLKYALNYVEVKKIVKQRLIRVDGKVRTHHCYPTGFMDVVSVERTGEHYRILYDVKGRFVVHRISAEEAKYKLCKVRSLRVMRAGVPSISTHDGRTIRYPDPLVRVNDTVLLDIATGKISQFVKFDTGNLCMITGGANLGRVGIVTHRERHPGSFDIIYIKDQLGHSFATRMHNVFIIGKGTKPWISLPKGRGVRLTIAEERDRRLAQKAGLSKLPAPAAEEKKEEKKEAKPEKKAEKPAEAEKTEKAEKEPEAPKAAAAKPAQPAAAAKKPAAPAAAAGKAPAKK